MRAVLSAEKTGGPIHIHVAEQEREVEDRQFLGDAGEDAGVHHRHLDRAALHRRDDRLVEFIQASVVELDAALRALEPGLAPDLKGWWLPGEGQLLPRELLAALAEQAPGVRWLWGRQATAVLPNRIELDDGTAVDLGPATQALMRPRAAAPADQAPVINQLQGRAKVSVPSKTTRPRAMPMIRSQ